jgi:hypothetical protein
MARARAWLPLLCLVAACEGGSAGTSDLLVGDVVIATTGDAARLSGVRRLDGNLTVRPGPNLRDLMLPGLERVDGRLLVEGAGDKIESARLQFTALTRVGLDVEIARSSGTLTFEAPALRLVGGHLDVHELATLDLRLPALADLNGDLRVRDARLAALQAPLLARIGGSVRFDRYAAGTETAPAHATLALDLPLLTAVGGDARFRMGAETIWQAPLLTTIAGEWEILGMRFRPRLPALAAIGGSLRVSRATLVSPELAALAKVGTDLSLESLTLEGTDALTFGALGTVGSQLEIVEVGNLRELTIMGLRSVGARLRFARNASLRQVTIAGAAELPSDLEISSCAGPLALALPDTIKLGGSLVVVDSGELSLGLPRLEAVTGSVRLAEVSLRLFQAPLLNRIEQSLELRAVAGHGLRSLALPALTSVTHGVTLERTRFIDEIALPVLASVGSAPGGIPHGDLRVVGNEVLQTLDLTGLQRVEVDLVIQRNASLPVQDSTFAPVMVGGQRKVCENATGQPVCP